MAAKGYLVEGSALVSTGLGQGITPPGGLRWSRSWKRSPGDTTAGPPHDTTVVVSGYVVRDSTWLRGPEGVKAWALLLDHLKALDHRDFPVHLFFKPRPGEPPTFVPEATLVGAPPGAGVIAVLRLEFSANLDYMDNTLGPPGNRGRVEKFLSFLSGGGEWGASTMLLLTLLDGRTGEVLWCDGQHVVNPYDRRRIDKMMAKIIERLP